jgi:selenide,water dikinase
MQYTSKEPVRLTQYSHGAGCGCKISPALLDEILKTSSIEKTHFSQLIVGNDSKDDAAVMDLGDGTGIISTTDFFMPIVDDPFTFGRIAATNAISDIYAMGGKPLMAIAIFGWPIDKLSAEVASAVIDGGKQACHDAGIPLAGGHSIDAPEPIFGLAVTGRVALDQLKRNDQAQVGDYLFLTKPLGIGILTTAQKSGVLRDEDRDTASDLMCQLNHIGYELGQISDVHAMTDVTGFGLGGHLLELCQGSKTAAMIDLARIPKIRNIDTYLKENQIPGGTHRNFASYGKHLDELTDEEKAIVCDPQTSGGLLISVAQTAVEQVQELLKAQGKLAEPIGRIIAAERNEKTVRFGSF